MSNLSHYPSNLLQQRIDDGDLQPDPGQLAVARELDHLVDVIAKMGRRNWISGLIGKSSAPKGLYIYGGVGRGKTMLMDMFFAALPEGPASPRKWRLHFHDFMVLAQDLIHESRQSGADDPIDEAARRLAEKGRVICFDEMEVRDIADAMILSRLFTNILERGVIIVTTSNRHADELYKNGLHRDRFMPFIELLKTRCKMLPIAEGQDWRSAMLAKMPAWYDRTLSHEVSLPAVFDGLRGDIPITPETIRVAGRDIFIAETAGDIAFVSFADLCEVPLAARDYLAIAGRFAGIVMTDVPIFTAERENAARRFMWMIDALYDRSRFFIASADGPIDGLYHGHQFEFEFARTMSRLHEMTSGEKSPRSDI